MAFVAIRTRERPEDSTSFEVARWEGVEAGVRVLPLVPAGPTRPRTRRVRHRGTKLSSSQLAAAYRAAGQDQSFQEDVGKVTNDFDDATADGLR